MRLLCICDWSQLVRERWVVSLITRTLVRGVPYLFISVLFLTYHLLSYFLLRHSCSYILQAFHTSHCACQDAHGARGAAHEGNGTHRCPGTLHQKGRGQGTCYCTMAAPRSSIII